MKQLQSFFLGIIGALGALFLEIAILTFFFPASKISEELTSFGYFFFLAILSEEFFKFFLIYKLTSKTEKITSVTINSMIFGLGFSMLEMFLLYWNYVNGTSSEFIDILGVLIIHISTSTLIGYSTAKSDMKLSSSLLFGFIPAFLIHSAYNVFKISEITHQKELIIVLLILLILTDIFLLIKSKNKSSEPNLAI